MPDQTLKRCFVICPIGARDSDVRKRSNDIFEHLIKPIAVSHGFNAYRINDDSRPGEITPNIVKELVEADLVVADLTGENPNVFYELAVRHSTGKPFIQLAAEGTRPPFDITTLNTIEIAEAGFGAIERTKAELAKHFDAVNAGTASYENPLSRYQQRLHAQQSGDPVEQQLEALRDTISRLSAELSEVRATSFALSDAVFDEYNRRRKIRLQTLRPLTEEERAARSAALTAGRKAAQETP